MEGSSGEPFCYLTTRGRRTGRSHTIEIWFAIHGERVYLLSGGGRRADWVRNLIEDAGVQVRVGPDVRGGRARIVEDTGEDRLARRLLAAKYQGWREGEPMSGWASTALPIAVDLSGRG